MPKLSRKALSEVKYVSMKDYYENVDKLNTLKDKLAYTTRYILSHDHYDLEHDYSFAAVVQMARVKIAESAVKEAKLDPAVELFLGNPQEYIKGEAKKFIDFVKEENVNLPGEAPQAENCQNLIDRIDGDFNIEVFDLDNRSAVLGVKSRLESNLGGKKGLEEVMEATKPSLFSRIFSTSSPQFAALEDAYDAFNNPNENGFGNMDNLDRAATDYLKHKFPKWDPSQEIPAEAYSKLNPTEMAKVNFSIAIKNSIKEQKAVDGPFHALVEGSKLKDLHYSDLAAMKENNVIDLEQQEFQNQIQENLASEEVDINAQIDLDDSNDFRLLKDEVEEEGPAISNQ